MECPEALPPFLLSLAVALLLPAAASAQVWRPRSSTDALAPLEPIRADRSRSRRHRSAHHRGRRAGRRSRRRRSVAATVRELAADPPRGRRGGAAWHRTARRWPTSRRMTHASSSPSRTARYAATGRAVRRDRPGRRASPTTGSTTPSRRAPRSPPSGVAPRRSSRSSTAVSTSRSPTWPADLLPGYDATRRRRHGVRLRGARHVRRGADRDGRRQRHRGEGRRRGDEGAAGPRERGRRSSRTT